VIFRTVAQQLTRF